MAFTKTEVLMIQREWEAAADRGSWDWTTLIENNLWVQQKCPPGVIPDSWMEYLEQIQDADPDDSDEMESLEEDFPGVDKTWADRMRERGDSLTRQINSLDMQLTDIEEEGDQDAIQAAEKELDRWRDHLYMQRQLQEPEDMDRNRQMWLLECLTYENGIQEETENPLQALERLEFQRQDVVTPYRETDS